ncbi:MAG: zinc ribbon domain-containing protein [bacterium]|nr:zinc ribbon domain-containing protein [bacterium]
MPIFEYVCQDCDHPFETLVQGSQQPECPACGSAKLAKQFSAFAVKAGGGSLASDFPPACATCGDPRGPGACQL